MRSGWGGGGGRPIVWGGRPLTSGYSHVALGGVHAVVQGLDGHPSHRQPALWAHIETVTQDATSNSLCLIMGDRCIVSNIMFVVDAGL